MEKLPIDRKQILELLRSHGSLKALKKEYAQEIDSIAEELEIEYRIIEQRSKRTIVDDGLLEQERKDAAHKIETKYSDIATVIFAIMDGKEYEQYIWDIIAKQI